MSSSTVYEDGTYLSHNPTWHEADSPWKAGQIEKMIRRNQLTPKTVCEIGCGAGGILTHLADSFGTGIEFSGYDISPQALTICKPKERDNIRFYLKDLLAEPDNSWDIVMAIDVFEHVEDYMGFLRKLRPKGEYTIFHIPLDLSVQNLWRLKPILNGRATVGHLHYFTKETALATLRDTGYEIVDHFYTGSAIDTPGRSWKARLMRLPRNLSFALSPDLSVRVLGGRALMVLAR